MNKPGVGITVSDQCEYGLTTWGPDGTPMPAKKPTKWMSSSPQMLECLSRRCAGKHVHQPLMGGRAAEAAFYPMDLITAILRGMRNTADANHVEEESVDHPMKEEMNKLMAQLTVSADVPDLHSMTMAALSNAQDVAKQVAQTVLTLKYANGTTQKIRPAFKPEYKDDNTG